MVVIPLSIPRQSRNIGSVEDITNLRSGLLEYIFSFSIIQTLDFSIGIEGLNHHEDRYRPESKKEG
jgi:hypothetical protein